MGIQVANWNENRLEHRAEAAFLDRLADELETELRSAETFLNNLISRQQNLTAAILVAQSNDSAITLSPVQCHAAWQSHIISNDFSFNGLLSVEALSQSHGLDIISNPELQLALISYQRAMAFYANRAHLIAIDMKNLVDDYPEIFPRTLVPSDSSTSVDCRLDAMRASQEFRNKLASNHGRRSGIISSQTNQIALLHELQELVAIERR
jgi:hypothetical protein